MKLISWNVNGLRACMNKGFLDYFKEIDADIFCVQETKLQKDQIELELEGYEQYWNYAVKKGYSGTAVFTKNRILCIIIENNIKFCFIVKDKHEKTAAPVCPVPYMRDTYGKSLEFPYTGCPGYCVGRLYT